MQRKPSSYDRKYWIYALYDPRVPDAIRYVGYSHNPDKRLKAHIKEALKRDSVPTHKVNWLRKLLADGVTPWWISMECFVGTKPQAGAKETEYIAACRLAGYDLTNGTDGGDGSTGWSPEQREALRQRMAAYWSTDVAREKQRQAMKAFWESPESAALRESNKLSGAEAKKLQTYSLDTREKMRLAKLGKPGVPRTEEWKAKIAAAQKGKKRRPWTAEERERHMAAAANPETRARMSASAKARKDRLGKKIP